MNKEKRDRIQYRYSPPVSYKVPKQGWIHKNPRLFGGVFITCGLLIFFSRPLYDIFLRPDSEKIQPRTLK